MYANVNHQQIMGLNDVGLFLGISQKNYMYATNNAAVGN